MRNFKHFINFLISYLFKLIPTNSLLIRSYKALTIKEKLDLRLPYTNLKLINFLINFSSNNSQLSVFEYGSGSSTLFFEDYFDEVISVEHDKEWFDTINSIVSKANVNFVEIKKTDKPYFGSSKLGYKNFDFVEYVNFISKLNKKFDVIFIDGRSRDNCINIAKNYIKKGGIIILDDSYRKRYSKEFLSMSQDKEVMNFKGLGTFIPTWHKSSVVKF